MQPKLVWEHGAGTFRFRKRIMPARTNTSPSVIQGSVHLNQSGPNIDYDLLADKIAERIEAVLLKFTGGLHAGLLAALEARVVFPEAYYSHHHGRELAQKPAIAIDESLLDVGVSSAGLKSPEGQELTKPVVTQDTQLSSAADKLRRLKGK